MRELKFREIKFRAFDTENKTWTFVTLGDLICGACTEKGDRPLSGAKQVWGQYTGLKDKNGKEIYEGDIVRVARSYGYGFLPKGAKAKIEFDEKELCYKLRGQGEFRLTAKKELEVIGNIHDNPELLEDKE